MTIINWQLLALILSLILLFSFGLFLGIVFASKFSIYMKVSKKEDYEEKIKELDRMMEEFNKKVIEMETPEETKEKIRPFELFPEDLKRDFGLPRELR
jgi:membrane peptidoglycan carboxypeptidase